MYNLSYYNTSIYFRNSYIKKLFILIFLIDIQNIIQSLKSITLRTITNAPLFRNMFVIELSIMTST